MVTVVDRRSFTARLLLLLLFCSVLRLWEITNVYYVCNTINQAWVVMMGKNCKLLNLSEFTGLHRWFFDLQRATWLVEAKSSLGSDLGQYKSQTGSPSATLWDQEFDWLRICMGPRNLTGTKFGYVRERHSPAVLIRVTCQEKMRVTCLPLDYIYHDVGRCGSVVACATCKREITGSIAGWAEFAVDTVLLENPLPTRASSRPSVKVGAWKDQEGLCVCLAMCPKICGCQTVYAPRGVGMAFEWTGFCD